MEVIYSTNEYSAAFKRMPSIAWGHYVRNMWPKIVPLGYYVSNVFRGEFIGETGKLCENNHSNVTFGNCFILP